MTSTATPRSPLHARTTPLDPTTAARLVDLLHRDAPVSWLHKDEGLVGWGTVAGSSGVVRACSGERGVAVLVTPRDY